MDDISIQQYSHFSRLNRGRTGLGSIPLIPIPLKLLQIHFDSFIGETGVGWGKFWLGQCPSVPNELPDGETNYVFGEQVTTAFTGATCIIDARFASEISPKITF